MKKLFVFLITVMLFTSGVFAMTFNVDEFPIVQDSYQQWAPKIDKDIAVYTDNGSGNLNILGYDFETDEVFTVCTNTSAQYSPDISGDIVVWFDVRNGNADIYGYNLETQQEFQICIYSGDQIYPRIDGDWVVWQDYRNGTGNPDIYARNLETEEEKVICNNASSQLLPVISGNILVWYDFRNFYDEQNPDDPWWDLYGYNLSTEQEFAVCEHARDQFYPEISGNIIVWTDKRNGNYDIYGYNISTAEEFSVATGAYNQFLSVIDGDIVLWVTTQNGSEDIYGKDLNTGITFSVKTGSADQFMPSISRNRVVWLDEYGRQINVPDLYAGIISPSCDFNQDTFVNYLDYSVFSSHWLMDENDFNWLSDIDLVEDGVIDINDLDMFFNYWLWGNYFEPNPVSDPNLIYFIADANDLTEIRVEVGNTITLYFAISAESSSEVFLAQTEVQISDPNLGSIDNRDSTDPNSTAEILVSNPIMFEYGQGYEQEDGIYLFAAKTSAIEGDFASFEYTADEEGDVTLEISNYYSAYAGSGEEAYPTTSSIIIHQVSQEQIMIGREESMSSSCVQEANVENLISRIEEIITETSNQKELDAWNQILYFLKDSESSEY